MRRISVSEDIRSITKAVGLSFDQRFWKLAELAKDGRNLELVIASNEDLLLYGQVNLKRSIEPTREYFGGESPLIQDLSELRYSCSNHRRPKVVPRDAPLLLNSEFEFIYEDGISCSAFPTYFKRLDNVVQYAGFGGEWGSLPGYGWAIFGHIYLPINRAPHRLSQQRQ